MIATKAAVMAVNVTKSEIPAPQEIGNLRKAASKRVCGTVRYGRLHIEDGGETNGDVKNTGSKS